MPLRPCLLRLAFPSPTRRTWPVGAAFASCSQADVDRPCRLRSTLSRTRANPPPRPRAMACRPRGFVHSPWPHLPFERFTISTGLAPHARTHARIGALVHTYAAIKCLTHSGLSYSAAKCNGVKPWFEISFTSTDAPACSSRGTSAGAKAHARCKGVCATRELHRWPIS